MNVGYSDFISRVAGIESRALLLQPFLNLGYS
jgi:hypothetical protein